MGDSLIDRMRAAPRTTRTLRILGVDPDADTTGWAYIDAVLDSHAGLTIRRVYLGLIVPDQRGLADLEQAQVMIEAVVAFTLPGFPALDGVFVESQRIYPTPDEDPRTRVAKANDLLRLAQVTGAVQAWAMCHAHQPYVRAVPPADWKGQQRKEHTLAQLQKRLDSVPVLAAYPWRGKPTELELYGHDLNNLPASCGHAIDALGIAVWGANWLAGHPALLPSPAPKA